MANKNHYQAVASKPAAPEVLEAAVQEGVEAITDEQAEQPAPVGKYLIRAVHGTMIHPYVPMDIRPDTLTEVTEMDTWLESQIAAGKIVVV